MAAVEPKKITGGAFGRYMAENRAALIKECAGKPATASIKLGSERYKALDAAAKAKYEKMYAVAKEQYETDLAAFLAEGGVKTAPKSKKDKEDKEGKKAKKDPDAPKRPVGGGYGVYMNEHREEIVKGLPADHKITDVSKAAGAKWKALSETEQKKYNDKYQEKSEQFKKNMEEYKATLPEPVVEEQASPPAKATKRKAVDELQKKETPPKKTKASKGASKDNGVAIDADVMAEAKKVEMEGALKNLANRPEIVALGLKADKMLSTLKAHNGLVNPAKHALLGC